MYKKKCLFLGSACSRVLSTTLAITAISIVLACEPLTAQEYFTFPSGGASEFNSFWLPVQIGKNISRLLATFHHNFDQEFNHRANNLDRKNVTVGAPVGDPGSLFGPVQWNTQPGMTDEQGTRNLLVVAIVGGIIFFIVNRKKYRQLIQSDNPEVQEAFPLPDDKHKSNLSSIDWKDRDHSAVAINLESANVLFLKVRIALSKQDLSSIAGSLHSDIHRDLQIKIEELKSRNQCIHLENLRLTHSEILTSWYEDGYDYTTICFSAKVIDYTVDNLTGNIINGNKTLVVNIREDWTFTKEVETENWLLTNVIVYD